MLASLTNDVSVDAHKMYDLLDLFMSLIFHPNKISFETNQINEFYWNQFYWNSLRRHNEITLWKQVYNTF